MQRITLEQWEGLLRRLREGGCPVLRDHGYKMPPLGLAIERPPRSILNEIFDLVAGGTGYAIEFGLRNELDRPVDVQGFTLVTPWGMPRLSVLPAPRKRFFSYPHYILPDQSHYFDAGYILNPIFARRKSRLNPGEKVEGVLVALDQDSIPEEVADRARIPVTLAIFDSHRNRFAAQCEMLVDRTGLRVREREAEERAARERERPERAKRNRERKQLSSEEAAA